MSILCSRCRELKPSSEFWRCDKKRNGLQSYCKTCTLAKNKEWVAKNIDKVRAAKRSAIRPYTEKQREWHRRNYAANKERLLARNKAWWKNNPDKARVITLATTNRRRLVKLGCVGSHTEAEWRGLTGRYELRCAKCSDIKPLTRDHVIPLTSGGTDYIDNIQPLCKPCNSSKGTKTVRYFC